MTGPRFATEYDFYAGLPTLAASGASLEDVYRAMLTVTDDDLSRVEGSADRLHQLATLWTQSPHFIPIRLNEVFGGRPVEHTDDYVLAMIGGLGARNDGRIRAFLLRHDDELREQMFWRIFEVEGGGEISLANVDKFSADEASWKNTVLALVADGTLDRARVLRCCLDALNRDFSSYRAGWFSQAYALLKPTPAEASVDQDLLRLLLGSSITASVSLAVRQLAAVHRAGRLDAAEFVAACGPALTGAKGNATAILKVLGSLARDDRTDIDELLAAAALGLQNPHPDVQRTTIALLQAHGRAAVVSEQRDLLAPAVMRELVPAGDPVEMTEPAMAPPPLPEAVPVTPWADAEAVDRMAALLEECVDPVEFELALAWLARAPEPAATLAPLVRRARKRVDSESKYIARLVIAAAEPASDFLPRTTFTSVITRVIDGAYVSRKGEPEPRPAEEETSPVPLVVARLREVAEIVRGRAPRRTLLATPTDSHGWLSPEAYDERRRTADGIAPLRYDELAAGLRLAGGPGPALPEVRVDWRDESFDYEAGGRRHTVRVWRPKVAASPVERWSAEQPTAIPSGEPCRHSWPVMLRELGLSFPSSTLPLVAGGIELMNFAVQEPTPVGEEHVLTALAEHGGAWTSATAELVALGLAASRAEIRAQAAELLVAAVPTRISVADFAVGMANCAEAAVPNRWATSLTDAAAISSHGAGVVIDVLTLLLPSVDRGRRGLGKILTVLLDESIRAGRNAADPRLRDWLAGFAGSSETARTARRLLALGDRPAG